MIVKILLLLWTDCGKRIIWRRVARTPPLPSTPGKYSANILDRFATTTERLVPELPLKKIKHPKLRKLRKKLAEMRCG